jgi:hypothetical protein
VCKYRGGLITKYFIPVELLSVSSIEKGLRRVVLYDEYDEGLTWCTGKRRRRFQLERKKMNLIGNLTIFH